MGERYYILRDREPVAVGLFEWSRWFNNHDNRRVGETVVGLWRVSTVFMGLDHSFSRDGPGYRRRLDP